MAEVDQSSLQALKMVGFNDCPAVGAGGRKNWPSVCPQDCTLARRVGWLVAKFCNDDDGFVVNSVWKVLVLYCNWSWEQGRPPFHWRQSLNSWLTIHKSHKQQLLLCHLLREPLILWPLDYWRGYVEFSSNNNILVVGGRWTLNFCQRRMWLFIFSLSMQLIYN